MTSTHSSSPGLTEHFAALRAQGLRARDAAHQLGLSEGEAMAIHSTGARPAAQAQGRYTTVALDGEWVRLLQALEHCGEVMALTRNDSVVHEKVGIYRHVSKTPHGNIALAVGPEIDLRIFLSHWHAGFHVIEHGEKGEQHSLQFFDEHGQAVHKVIARDGTDIQALAALVQHHARAELRPQFKPGRPERKAVRADGDIDVQGLSTAWAAMTDTHQFFELLAKFKVDRLQSLRLMEGTHTHRVPLASTQRLLDTAAQRALPIMVFVGNEGCIQIHTGPVHQIKTMGPWLNVLDAGFNLHLREDHVAESWLVIKPTEDGDVTSIEIFDERGDVMAMFFGERKPGQPELTGWRELAHELRQPRQLPEDAVEAAA